MKKTVQKLSIFFMAIIIIFSSFVAYFYVASTHTKIYINTYHAALVDKTNLLKENEDNNKIVLIGGSNVAFGLNSELLENEFEDYKIINFGLDENLGIKIMLDISKEYVNYGDIVIISPEISAQSMSLHYDAMNILKATEDDTSIIKKLPYNTKREILKTSFRFIRERKEYSEPIAPTGVYQRKNFNHYGDIVYNEKDQDNELLISKNRMGDLHYDPSTMIDFSLQLNNEFINYINEYADYVSQKGAKVYYAFSPVNELAVIQDGEDLENSAINLYWNLRENLDIDVIGNPLDYIIDACYFFDSNYHLNTAGAILRTRILAQDISRDIFNYSSNVSIEVPNEPTYSSVEKNRLGVSEK